MKKLFFTLMTLCLCGATWAANGTPDITITSAESGLAHTYYFDIVSATNRTVELTYNGTWNSWPENSYSGAITDIPETITYNGNTYSVIGIGEYTFANCANVTSMVIPGFIQYIDTYGIFGMDYCKTIIFESSNNTLQITDGTANGVSILDYVQLTDLTLNRNITITSNHSLNLSGLCVGNEYLKKLSIGGAATEVYDYSFENCTALTDVILSDSITTIGSHAFSGCTSLNEIAIPASVKTYEESCFSGCTSLSRIFLLATDPSGVSFETNVFQSDTGIFLYVPRGSAAAYNGSSWRTTANSYDMSFNFFSPTSIDATTADEEGNYYATYYYDGEANYEIDAYSTSGIYAVTGVGDNVVVMTSLTTTADIIPSGTPLLIQSTEAGAYYFWRDFYGEDANQAGYYTGITPSMFSNPNGNMLYGHSEAGYTSVNGVTDGYKFYKLSLNPAGESGSIGFYWGAADGGTYTAGANRCWLAVPTASNSADGISIKKSDEGDTTGISSVESAVEGASVKGIYTIQGVRVSNMNQPGLYIVDGKKVLVK